MSDPVRDIRLHKPMRGEFRRARKQAAREQKAEEQKLMDAAKKLDGYQCRRPRCPHCRNKAKAVAACHRRDMHRRMGGDRALERTRLEWLVTLCVDSHDDYDEFRLDIDPTDEARYFRSPCAWYEVNLETGERTHIATEQVIGISVSVGA